MQPKTYLLISALVFAIVATAHLTRLIYRWPIELGSWSVPSWVSGPGFALPGALSIWGFQLARNKRSA